MHDYYAMPNTQQSPEQRKAKYHLAKMFAKDSEIARTLRDWNFSKISGFLQRIVPEQAEAIIEQVDITYNMFLDEMIAGRQDTNSFGNGWVPYPKKKAGE